MRGKSDFGLSGLARSRGGVATGAGAWNGVDVSRHRSEGVKLYRGQLKGLSALFLDRALRSGVEARAHTRTRSACTAAIL